ncbi:hypothetical protein [Bryobacter aggregatus]|uniref:hypothetical protein n=1 Tax=Bryobacter aggregatus TaxID=360054 RepID=UPI0004E25758|nr:hypothetical protein [Bryobacter aggregatus]
MQQRELTRLVILVGSVGLGAFWLLRLSAEPAQALAPPALAREELSVVSATLGGTVSEVLVQQGAELRTGQSLLRFRSQPSLRNSQEQLATLRGLLSRVPLQTWQSLLHSDPDRLAAEQEYADALAAQEANPAPGNRARLRAAERKRVLVQQRLGALRPEQLASLSLEDGQEKELRRRFEQLVGDNEVRATRAGRIVVLDLHPGDFVEPYGRVALVAVTAR